jgi:N-acetylglucosamine-6-phosphate deacetylase
VSEAALLGRAVLADGVVPARIDIDRGRIAGVRPDPAGAGGPYLVPGFIDIHVHGGGGFDAMDGADALAGMARVLLRRGVTTFLPTAVSAPLEALDQFARTVRAFMDAPDATAADAVGFNLEGPFLAPGRRGAHELAHLITPSAIERTGLERLLPGLRVITVAPELDGAIELIAWLAEREVVVSLGHSDATLDQARAGYRAGARSTTHLFNAMSALAHREPGLTGAALAEDGASVELIADGHHVHPALWPVVLRAKPARRLLAVSDAIALAGTGDGRGRIGPLEIEVRGGRSTLAGRTTLAGSVIGLDDAVRNLVAAGISLADAVASASTNPADLVGLEDRGRIAVGARADIVELDDDLRVVGVTHAGVRTKPDPDGG